MKDMGYILNRPLTKPLNDLFYARLVSAIGTVMHTHSSAEVSWENTMHLIRVGADRMERVRIQDKYFDNLPGRDRAVKVLEECQKYDSEVVELWQSYASEMSDFEKLMLDWPNLK